MNLALAHPPGIHRSTAAHARAYSGSAMQQASARGQGAPKTEKGYSGYKVAPHVYALIRVMEDACTLAPIWVMQHACTLAPH